MAINKECFWRHGAWKTVKLESYVFEGKSTNNNYKVKRWIVIQQCGFCGKVKMETNNN